jgi:hypothetical protein
MSPDREEGREDTKLIIRTANTESFSGIIGYCTVMSINMRGSSIGHPRVSQASSLSVPTIDDSNRRQVDINPISYIQPVIFFCLDRGHSERGEILDLRSLTRLERPIILYCKLS